MKTKIIAIFVTIIIMLSIFLVNSLSTSATEKALNTNINEIMNNILKLQSEGAPLAASSNPYDYVKENKEFDNIVAIGTEALPIIKQKIDNGENGLKEYILAIATEKIAKVNLRGDNNFGWATATEWSSTWNKHLKNLPNKYKSIKNSTSNQNEKVNEVLKLGTPVIPFILDDIEQGDNTLLLALKKLNVDTNSVTDYKSWAKSNKDKFSNLKKLVDSAK